MHCVSGRSLHLHKYVADKRSICAIAARYYKKRDDLNGKLSAFAKRLAFEVPSRGYKSVEVVQAYLLLSLWTLGPEKTYVINVEPAVRVSVRANPC